MITCCSARIIVSGKVQGIGYRWFVQGKGREFHITGWVKNLPNRAVEIEVEGSKEDIEQFLHSIKHDHPAATVRDVSIEWLPFTRKHFNDFVIEF
jgi:acylphosphatase